MNRCCICGEYFSDVKHLRKHKIKSEEYYLKYIGERGRCIVCGCLTRFLNINKGYSLYCSSSCVSKDENIKQKKKETLIKNYGVDSPLKSEIILNKSKQTNCHRYGVDNYSKTDEYIEKTKSTCELKYNETHHSKSDTVKNKKKETLNNKYGVNSPFQIPEVQDKIQNSNLKKYGTKQIFSSKQIIEKIKDTIKKKYGNEYYSQTTDFKNKVRTTLLNKNYQQLLKSDKFKTLVIPLFNITEYQGIGDNKKEFNTPKYKWLCQKCGNIFYDRLNNGHIPRCAVCFPIFNGTSIYEEQICDCLNIKCIKNDRNVLDNQELDIYIPSHNLAIEFNGLYWHSEIGGKKDRRYHLNKTIKCYEKEIQLLHVFEDEWIEKQDIVKSIIRNKLGLIKNKIYARKCYVTTLCKEDAELFLNRNHIQGDINGIHIGLIYDNDICMILTIGKPRFNKNYEYEILRFCNKIDIRVIGGLTKLYNYFERVYKPSSVITYSDLRYGLGKSYLKCGFEYKGFSKPNYYYMKDYKIRESRLKYQKHKLENKLEIYDSSLSEWENMQLNGYDRIWDCGNNVYTKNVK